MPTALDIFTKVQLAYPDATLFWDKEGEKILFYDNGLRFVVHPFQKGVSVVITRDKKQVFKGSIRAERFDIGKCVNTFQVLAKTVSKMGRPEEC